MNKNKVVSINILTYNAQELIEPCLQSVLGQSYSDIEILIIDNNSADDSVKIIKKFISNNELGREIKLIENKKNTGYAGGHNQGIKESDGEYVLCLNQDVVLDKDFIKEAVEVLKKDEKVAAVQGKLLKINSMWEAGPPTSEHKIDTTGLLMFKNRRIVGRGQGEKDTDQYKAGEIFGADGAAPLYRRSALEDIKIEGEYFDETFFLYKEDIDIAWRLRLYGWKAVYQPSVIGYHIRGAGDSAKRDVVSIISQRRKISKLAKFLSFKNQRLMQVKNELWPLFFSSFHRIIVKEIGAWAYVLFFEKYGLKSISHLFKEAPEAYRKRKIIMRKVKIINEGNLSRAVRGMKRWFK